MKYKSLNWCISINQPENKEMDNAQDLVDIGTFIATDEGHIGEVTEIIGGTVFLDSGDSLLLADIRHDDIIGE